MEINWSEFFIDFVIFAGIFVVTIQGYKFLETWLAGRSTTLGGYLREGIAQSKTKKGGKKYNWYYFGLMFLVYLPISLWWRPLFLPGILFLALSVVASRFVAVWFLGRQETLKEKALYEAELAEQQARKQNKDSD